MNQRTQAALRKWAYSGGDFARDVGWGGGGALTGMLVNNLLGNDSLQSYLLSGGIGAVGGLGLKSAIKSIAKANDVQLDRTALGAALFGKEHRLIDPTGTEVMTATGLAGGAALSAKQGISERRVYVDKIEEENRRRDIQIREAVTEENRRRKAVAEQNLAKAQADFGVRSAQYQQAKAVYDAEMIKYNAAKQAHADAVADYNQYRAKMKVFLDTSAQNKALREAWEAAGRNPKKRPNWINPGLTKPKEVANPGKFTLVEPTAPVEPVPPVNINGDVKYNKLRMPKVNIHSRPAAVQWGKEIGKGTAKTAALTGIMALIGYLFDSGRHRFVYGE